MSQQCNSQKQSLDLYKQYQIEDFNKILGAIYGMAIGNHVGATLERSTSEIKMDQSLHLNGGGMFRVKDGQIMEESQLQIILMAELINIHYKNQKTGENCFNLQNDDIKKIKARYQEFFNDNSFGRYEDVTKQILSNSVYGSEILLEKSVEIKEKNKSNEELNKLPNNQKSNGHLARALPIALIFTQYNEYSSLRNVIYKEMKITHKGEDLLNISYYYVKAIILILKNYSLREIWKVIEEEMKKDHNDLYKKLNEGEVNNDLLDDTAFIEKNQEAIFPWKYCMRYLKKISNKNYILQTFNEDINEFCKKNSNLKINLCIFGGFVGAVHGFKNIPDDLKFKIYNSLKADNHKDTIDNFISRLKPCNQSYSSMISEECQDHINRNVKIKPKQEGRELQQGPLCNNNKCTIF